ncbi:MAG: hypothetical protein ACE5GF_02110, partial [Thermodesulfobacteriota bacterium]
LLISGQVLKNAVFLLLSRTNAEVVLFKPILIALGIIGLGSFKVPCISTNIILTKRNVLCSNRAGKCLVQEEMYSLSIFRLSTKEDVILNEDVKLAFLLLCCAIALIIVGAMFF